MKHQPRRIVILSAIAGTVLMGAAGFAAAASGDRPARQEVEVESEHEREIEHEVEVEVENEHGIEVEAGDDNGGDRPDNQSDDPADHDINDDNGGDR
ncbi:MAG TPA: hypothetical protein DCR14_10255, partial [Acidimicrobiaceae bacterium]|nr:hypothetical protein [Acidimicrobiaceae bacterium]